MENAALWGYVQLTPRASTRAVEITDENTGPDPVKCDYCRCPIWEGETIPGHAH